MTKKWILILTILSVLALLVASCTAEPGNSSMDDDDSMTEESDMDDAEDMDDDMEEDDNNGSEMENDDDMDNSSSSADSSDDEDSGMAGEGSDQTGTTDESTDEEMTDEEMISFIEEKVGGKHDTDRILNADKTFDEWVETLDRMIGYGAEIDEEEKELIINWLLERKESMMDEGDMAEEEMAMTDDEMVAFIEEKVGGKHDTDRILNADKTFDEWVETLDRMIGYGANIDEEEKELIINWLLERKESMMDEGDMAEEEMAMTDDEMIAFIEEKLDGQHDLDRVLNADKTYDEWVVTLDRMIGYGAEIDEEEKELIIDWLLNR